MRPFDLEKALAGEPVITREGLEVTELYLAKTATNNTQRLIAVTEGSLKHYSEDGKWQFDKNDSSKDLFMAPVKRQEWVNIYQGDPLGQYKYVTGVALYRRKEDGEKAGDGCGNYMATVLIREWEE